MRPRIFAALCLLGTTLASPVKFEKREYVTETTISFPSNGPGLSIDLVYGPNGLMVPEKPAEDKMTEEMLQEKKSEKDSTKPDEKEGSKEKEEFHTESQAPITPGWDWEDPDKKMPDRTHVKVKPDGEIIATFPEDVMCNQNKINEKTPCFYPDEPKKVLDAHISQITTPLNNPECVDLNHIQYSVSVGDLNATVAVALSAQRLISEGYHHHVVAKTQCREFYVKPSDTWLVGNAREDIIENVARRIDNVNIDGFHHKLSHPKLVLLDAIVREFKPFWEAHAIKLVIKKALEQPDAKITLAAYFPVSMSADEALKEAKMSRVYQFVQPHTGARFNFVAYAVDPVVNEWNNMQEEQLSKAAANLYKKMKPLPDYPSSTDWTPDYSKVDVTEEGPSTPPATPPAKSPEAPPAKSPEAPPAKSPESPEAPEAPPVYGSSRPSLPSLPSLPATPVSPVQPVKPVGPVEPAAPKPESTIPITVTKPVSSY